MSAVTDLLRKWENGDGLSIQTAELREAIETDKLLAKSAVLLAVPGPPPKADDCGGKYWHDEHIFTKKNAQGKAITYKCKGRS